jgi:hypothetical protein
MPNQVVKSLHAAQDGRTSLLRAVNVLGQAFKYGVQPADLDLVPQMCSDPILTYEGAPRTVVGGRRSEGHRVAPHQVLNGGPAA